MCLQFTELIAASCVLHRYTSRVIHRLEHKFNGITESDKSWVCWRNPLAFLTQDTEFSLGTTTKISPRNPQGRQLVADSLHRPCSTTLRVSTRHSLRPFSYSKGYAGALPRSSWFDRSSPRRQRCPQSNTVHQAMS